MERVLSGMRPSGRLHLGHLYGALENWKRLQEDYECFFFVADWHALTTEYKNSGTIRESVGEMVMDWLSIGINPQKCILFIQSQIPEHAELHLLLSMITPLAWLERNPTYKEQQKELMDRDVDTYGFLGYPVLQAADILIYKAQKVPVGMDQVPHLELTREMARRFNYLYKEVFPLPQAILTQFPKLLGTDGRKMSKSYNNAIYLSDSPQEIKAKIQQMITDPQRQRRSDPGDPEVSAVFALHKIYSPPQDVAEIAESCRTAKIGCVECKERLTLRVIEALEPFRGRRTHYLDHPGEIREILAQGVVKARKIAKVTMEEVKGAMKILSADPVFIFKPFGD